MTHNIAQPTYFAAYHTSGAISELLGITTLIYLYEITFLASERALRINTGWVCRINVNAALIIECQGQLIVAAYVILGKV